MPWVSKLVDVLVWNISSVSFRCSLVSNIVFWIASSLGLYADHLVATNQSPLLSRCKLQPSRIVSGKDRDELIALAFFNMFFVACSVCCPLYELAWSWLRAGHRLTEADDWMSIWRSELFFKLPIHALVAEISFYGFHGLLHYSPVLYQHIHQVHHRFPAPTAMACVYAHPLEFALGNLLPIYLGPMVFTNAHPTTCYIWFSLAMLGTCKGHCGYRILGHADYHDAHHVLYRYNYGGMGLLDHLCGTTRPPPAKANTR